MPADPIAAFLMECGLAPEALVIGLVGVIFIVSVAAIGYAMSKDEAK